MLPIGPGSSYIETATRDPTTRGLRYQQQKGKSRRGKDNNNKVTWIYQRNCNDTMSTSYAYGMLKQGIHNTIDYVLYTSKVYIAKEKTKNKKTMHVICMHKH